MNRIAILVEQHGEPAPKDQAVTFFWRLLSAGDEALAKQLHGSKEKFKPYAWAYKQGMLTFASVREDIALALKEGAISLIGQGIMIENNVFEVKKVLPIQPVQRISGRMTVKALSPIALSYRGEDGKKKPVFLDQDEELWKKLLAQNLVRRTNAFLNLELLPNAVGVRIVQKGFPCSIPYKFPVPARADVVIELMGEPEAIEVALYGGLGERTGSGFGLVVPV